MADYRIFLLGPADRVVGAEVITCPDDAEALRVAGPYLGNHLALEVWHRARRVGRISAASVHGEPPSVTYFP